MEKEGIWSESFKVMAFMVDQQRRMTSPMLCNLLQEVAGNHANFRKLGFFDMQAQNRFWVLNRLRLEIEEYPLWLDEIEVQTWVSMMRGPFSNRHFAVFKNGKKIASAFTFWVAIDSITHKPVRINSQEVIVLEDKIADCGPAEKLEPFQDGQILGNYKVQASDIDMLGHVNNVKYTEWVLNIVSLNKPIQLLEINYLKETDLGKETNIYSNENNFAIRSAADGQDICLFRIR
jgi:acyl-ACP thioesterase